MSNRKSRGGLTFRNSESGQQPRGTVVWADDPFKNKGTTRPWVIVNNQQYTVPDKNLVVPLTTQKHEESIEIPRSDWAVRNLRSTSFANPWVLRELDSSCFNGKCGMLLPEATDRVVDETLSYISDSMTGTPREKQYERGAIVSAWDRFGESNELSRWVIISNDSHPFGFKYLSAHLSDTQLRSDGQTVTIDTSAFPDLSESFVTATHLTPLNEDDISRQVGWIGGDPVERVVNQLRLSLL